MSRTEPSGAGVSMPSHAGTMGRRDEVQARPSRLALGTAQFGIPYGVANAGGQVPATVAASILTRAAHSRVDTIDTAVAYGSSESVLGSCGMSGWRIITKLPPLPPGIDDVGRWVDREIRGSLARLGVDRVDAVLLHRSADVLDLHGAGYRRALMAAKDAELTSAIGVSIYSPAELDALWPVFRPDIVQAPLNVLDRRLIQSGWLSRLALAGVRVHTRSVFLQGLLLMPADKRPAYFRPWSGILDAWVEWYRGEGCTALSAALGFPLAQSEIERIVVGVDSLDQLNEIIESATREMPEPPPSLGSSDLALIEPSRWTLR